MNRNFSFLFFLVFSYVIAFIGIYFKIPASWFLSVLLPVFDCFLLYIVIHLFSLIRLRFVGWLLGFLAALIFLGELFTLFCYRSFYSIYVIQLVLETNLRESKEFLASSWHHSALLYSLLWLVFVVVFSYGLSRLWKPCRNKRVLIFLVCILIMWSGVRQFSAYRKIYYAFSNPDIALLTDNSAKMPHLNSPFVRLLYGIAFNKAQTARLDNLYSSMEQTIVDSCSFRSPLILLVIGESYNKHHAHIYDSTYLPTTPRLERLQSSGHLIVLNDVVSPSNLTSEVFKKMFSLWDEDYDEDWTHYTLFPVLFRKAGYRIWFLTNQFTIGSINSSNIVGGTIFNSPRLSDYQFSYRNKENYEYDLDLLQELPPSDTLASFPTLLIVHLMGQHVKFRERYPRNIRVFTQKTSEPHLAVIPERRLPVSTIMLPITTIWLLTASSKHSKIWSVWEYIYLTTVRRHTIGDLHRAGRVRRK